MQTSTGHIRTIATTPSQPEAGIRAATADDEASLVAVLTVAFAADPPARWVYPDAGQYMRHFPEFVRAFGGRAVDKGTALCTAGFSGCALWLPPGREPNESTLVELIERSLPRSRHTEVFAVLEAMGRAHPTESHWYLPLIGVDVALQGRGIGSTLLQHSLAVCDRLGLPAYLEATSPGNAALYERHGFRRREPLQVGSCPLITPMWREPK